MRDVLTGLGLVVGMAGAVAAFFWGFPQPSEGDALLLETSPGPEEQARAKQRRKRRSYVGLALLFVGFALQLAGLLVGE
jgi:hypothetical protein